MIQWHVFLSVPNHYNPYSCNFDAHASFLKCPPTDCNSYSANLAGGASLLTCPITEFFQKLLFSQKLLRFWACFNTLIVSHWIEVDIERLLFSLAVKMPNFWGPRIDKKVINSSSKCLISVKIAILTPHIIPPPLVNVWLIFDLQKYVNWLCMFLEVNPCFQRALHPLYGSTTSCRSIQCCM